MASFKYEKDGEWYKAGLGRGVTSFKGRYGNVEPQDGDYTPDQVGAAPASHASQHAADGEDPLTPEMIGAHPETWMPTAADVGAPMMTGQSQHISGSGWYRVGTIPSTGAWRFICGGTYNAHPVRWAIVDVASNYYSIGGVKTVSSPYNSRGNALATIRFVTLDSGGFAVDIQYTSASSNLVYVNCVSYWYKSPFTPAERFELITDEVTPALTLSLS